VLAVLTVALGASALTLLGAPTSGRAVAVDTALPPAWELCILQGVNAPLTAPNVADLDVWQVEEGGSTNNTAAYNPFNTARTTDVTGAALKTVPSPGFPAFADWLDGCAATVATLLQPNMTPIVAGLRAGGLTPSAAFLALVDQSQWCAPSADGTPCYANAILGSAGYLVGGVLTRSTAPDVYGNVSTDLQHYELDTLSIASDKRDVATKNQQFDVARSALSSMRAKFHASERVLRDFAVDEYVSTGLYVSSSYLSPGSDHASFGPPTPTGVVAQQYESVAASGVLARTGKAEAALRASESRRDAADKALQQAVSTLSADTSAENRALLRLVADVATMQTAGACTAVTITVPGLGATAGPTTTTGPTAAPGTAPTLDTTTTTTTAPATTPTSSTTTTTTAPPASTTTTSSSTTTTTTSSTTTTTTTSTTTTTTTTTQPTTTTTSSTTTTTTAPPSSGSTTTSTSAPTTTTTTAPGSPAPATTPPPTPNPAGIQALQGCVAALAPQAPSPTS
jgi:hypothetical protein